MKTLLSFFTILLLSFTAITAYADEPKTGDTVAAVWTDGLLYLGTVTGVSGNQVAVLFNDGDSLKVDAAKARVLSMRTAFKVGDRVIAAWKAAQMFPGVITAVSEVSCTVKWDDGDKPIEFAKNRILLATK